MRRIIPTISLRFGACLGGILLILLTIITSRPAANQIDYLSESLSLRRFRNNLKESMNALPNNIGTTSNLVNITTTTPQPIRDDFRHWFDMRPKVLPFVSSEFHPLLPATLISSKVCANSSVDILIYFNSACENIQRRRILRETWANGHVFKDISIRVVFVLGIPSKREVAKHIKLERQVYGDIIQGDFKDTTRNLTYKAMLALKWINDNCAHARYVIKADDDIFINILKVVEGFLPRIYLRNRTIMCHYKKEGTSPIIRDSKSQWYVPDTVLPKSKTLPKFCSGYAVIMTTDIIPLLYHSSFRAPFLPVDDVYLFGLLPMFSKKLTYLDATPNFTLNSKYALDQYKSSLPLTYVVTSASIEGTQEEYWSHALRKASIWSKRHTHIATLRTLMGPISL